MAQQQRAAASGGFDQHRQRAQPGSLADAALLLDFFDPLAGQRKIRSRPQHHCHRSIAIAAGAAGFLVIGLDRFGDPGMGDKAHVGLVDPHSEGDCCHDHDVFAGNKGRLIGGADLRIEPGVIGQHGASGSRAELFGQLLDLAAGRRIDDPRTWLLGHQIAQLPQAIVAVEDGITDVGPVKPGDNQAIGGNTQLRHDIGAGLRVRRGGQRQTRNLRKGIHQGPQQPVIGAEIMAPFRHTMRLVDREQRDRCGAQQFAEMGLAGAFGGDIEEIEPATPKPLDRLLAVGIGAGQRSGANAVGLG